MIPSRKEGSMGQPEHFMAQEARKVGEALRIDWSEFDVEQSRRGLDVELEQGTVDPRTDVTHEDSLLTGKLALAHLNEFPDYLLRAARAHGIRGSKPTENARGAQGQAAHITSSDHQLGERTPTTGCILSTRRVLATSVPVLSIGVYYVVQVERDIVPY